jgi:acetyl-CoA carboxylase biotin carboxyl carrier protein
MSTHDPAWLERVEELIRVIEGSSVGELELTEAGTEIIIRRNPGMMLVNVPPTPQFVVSSDSNSPAVMPAGTGVRNDGVAVLAPLTGVYYDAASPNSPPFANVGDIVQVGQVVALIEAMKIFTEVQAEISGRVLSLSGKSGEVVQKGDVLLRIQPL